MRFLLDTNICIYLIKRSDEKLLRRIGKHSVDAVMLSSITLAELDYGVEKSAKREQNRRALDEFTGAFTIVSFDEAASLRYGAVRSQLEQRGNPIGPLDLLIAAHALSVDATLITRNTKEFSRVSGLQIEDWAV